MTTPQDIIRRDVLAMTSYPVPDASGYVKLDAMENPFELPPALAAQLAERLSGVALNRYPAPRPGALIDKLKRVMRVPADCDVLLGNGSDEIISIISVACARPGAKVLAPVPGFVMYQVSAQFANLEFVGVPLNADFTLDTGAMIAAIEAHQPAGCEPIADATAVVKAELEDATALEGRGAAEVIGRAEQPNIA